MADCVIRRKCILRLFSIRKFKNYQDVSGSVSWQWAKRFGKLQQLHLVTWLNLAPVERAAVVSQHGVVEHEQLLVRSKSLLIADAALEVAQRCAGQHRKSQLLFVADKHREFERSHSC